MEAESFRVKEARKKLVDDVEKRGEYRKRHGLEQSGDEGGFGGFGSKRKGEDGRVRGALLVNQAALKEAEEDTGMETEEKWVEDGLKKMEEEAMGGAEKKGA